MDEATLGFSFDETTTREDVSLLWEIFAGRKPAFAPADGSTREAWAAKRRRALERDPDPKPGALVDLELVRLAAALPMAWKNAGAFESRLIAQRHAGVARHASSYGFAFVDGPDVRARFSEWLTGARPVGLRPRIAAMGRWLRKDRVSPHKIATWRAKLPGEWRLDSMPDLDRLSADGAFERALSVEIVARELRP